MGANIGTTITSWILSLTGIQSDNFIIQMFKPTSFSPVLAIIGVIFILFINDSKRIEDKKRRRDIVVKSDINGIYCILGIEHQSSIDETMVIRCGIYEMLEYLKQAENKEYKRLVPQIIVVLYTGPKKWNSPVKLSDYFEIPEELKKYFDDWKIIL